MVFVERLWRKSALIIMKVPVSNDGFVERNDKMSCKSIIMEDESLSGCSSFRCHVGLSISPFITDSRSVVPCIYEKNDFSLGYKNKNLMGSERDKLDVIIFIRKFETINKQLKNCFSKLLQNSFTNNENCLPFVATIVLTLINSMQIKC